VKMSRVKKSSSSKKRRKKVLKMAKGARGGRSKLYRSALETVRKGMQYSYRDRKQKKREFRKLWIARISAACKQRRLSYNKFMNGLMKANIRLNRKILSEIAINDSKTFDKLVAVVKQNLK